jgi:hypothetical protein
MFLFAIGNILLRRHLHWCQAPAIPRASPKLATLQFIMASTSTFRAPSLGDQICLQSSEPLPFAMVVVYYKDESECNAFCCVKAELRKKTQYFFEGTIIR